MHGSGIYRVQGQTWSLALKAELQFILLWLYIKGYGWMALDGCERRTPSLKVHYKTDMLTSCEGQCTQVPSVL